MKSTAPRPIVEMAAEWIAACCLGGGGGFCTARLAPGGCLLAGGGGAAGRRGGALLLVGCVDRHGVSIAGFEPVAIGALDLTRRDDALLLDEPAELPILLLDEPVAGRANRAWCDCSPRDPRPPRARPPFPSRARCWPGSSNFSARAGARQSVVPARPANDGVGGGQRGAACRARRYPPFAAAGLSRSASAPPGRRGSRRRRHRASAVTRRCRRRHGRAAAIRRRRARRGARRRAVAASGPGMRRLISWRSPVKVSDCQSTERKALTSTASRASAGARQQRRAAIGPRRGTGSRASGSPLEKGADAVDRPVARFAAVTQVEYKSWIAHHLAAETGRGDLADPQEFLNFGQ